MNARYTALSLLAGFALPACTVSADHLLSFEPGQVLSLEANQIPGGADPGQAAAKGRLKRLMNTPGGVHDGRLVMVYSDENSQDFIWCPKANVHRARDVFMRFSDDEGATWSNPLNLSNTADLFSSLTDWDGDGAPEPYYGDSGFPHLFESGDVVVVSWVDRYAPESWWTFGDVGQSTIQGSASYSDPAVSPSAREIPYACVMMAISTDGGDSWTYGGTEPPLQLTHGRRDATQNVARGNDQRWILTWQEDPEGLRPDEGVDFGFGATGATVTRGTDVWYTYTGNIFTNPEGLAANRTPLSNNSQYDTQGLNGFPTVGEPGSLSTNGAGRPHLGMVFDQGAWRALIAYEETKGDPAFENGKTVQYHAFQYNQPFTSGNPAALSGTAGVTVSDPSEHAQRVRFARQNTDGSVPALAIYWKQGVGVDDLPADVMMRVAHSFDPVAVATAPLLNMSSNTPSAQPADLLDETGDDPFEQAREHRAVLRGDFIGLAYAYTPDGLLAKYTDLQNYDLYFRRSTDGGQTWTAPEQLSNIFDTSLHATDPRIVMTPEGPGAGADNMVIVWATRDNVYHGLQEEQYQNLWIRRSVDMGETFDFKVNIAATVGQEYEAQVRLNEDASHVYAVWMEGAGPVEARFALGTTDNPLEVTVLNNPVSPGHAANLMFTGPGWENSPYFAGAAFGTEPGFTIPLGHIPLNLDDLFFASQENPATFVGFQGTLDANATALGAVALPANAALSGIEFYVAFLSVRFSPIPVGISEPALITIQ